MAHKIEKNEQLYDNTQVTVVLDVDTCTVKSVYTIDKNFHPKHVKIQSVKCKQMYT